MRSLSGPALYILVTVGAAPALAAPEPAAAERPAPVAVQRVHSVPQSIPEEAAILLVGTALIGIAAAVRRAV